ncbi:flagellar basal-body MS-ring/collar protein FliF [Sphingomonas sp. dw_22]|uniref:flagellar basal-body MS-ring/collar protein FliF n=1 Tax=Sphingomonas sp. dw_22 TaxID=2721175 RepID=UPI001BD1FC3E|nr:flagellar basal-body MS-ring/collar protein FliF [Sphingomonas sp. dw_22]
MSNALTPTDAARMPATFNPLKQVGDILAQPAVKRSLPFLFLVGLVAAGWLAWSMVATSPQRILFANVTDSDKAAITSALQGANIAASIDDSGSITVAEDQYHKARMLLASQNLPKAAPGGYAILDQLPMGVSRAVEGERLRQARETELARSIEEIDSVAEARVHLATPEASVFVRDHAEPSASVILKLQGGRALSEAQVRSIVNLVASSVPGMQPDAVTIVDQMGALLSKAGAGAGGNSLGDTRIDFQRRIEDKYRTQLIQLLTPLIGAGNFTAEVQADVDLDENQATRESYDKQGGVIRAEQGAWTGTSKDGNPQPGGIPGALSNTPPPASTLVAPNAQGQAANTTPPAGATPPGTPPVTQKQSDSFARTFETGKEISVTRAVPGNVKRLSVAVLLREEPGKPRGTVEIAQINELVKAAVGFNAGRQDQVTVISRKFSAPAEAAAGGPAWYDAGWVPLVARNATALVIVLLVLFLGVRPLAKALLKKREDVAHRPALAIGAPDDGAAPVAQPPVSIDMLQQGGNGYDDRVGLVRGFTRDNPARAALAVRDMIRADAQ